MYQRRRDNKNRVLKDGEFQRSDGRYEYKYTNPAGKRISIYSWRLVETDAQPNGKRRCAPLRTLEKEVRRDIEDGLSTDGDKVTLNEVFDIWIESAVWLQPATKAAHTGIYRKHIKDSIGNIPIGQITRKQLKDLYLDIVFKRKNSVTTVKRLNSILSGIFKTAIDSNTIRNNITVDLYKEIAAVCDRPTPKQPMTAEQQKRFVEFIMWHESAQSYSPILAMLWTGMRVGEMCALTWNDVDFENGIIHIDKTLQYYHDNDGRLHRNIKPPKTSSGVRTIPMVDEVRELLLSLPRNNPTSVIVNNKEYDLIFRSNKNNPLCKENIDTRLNRIVRQYNQFEETRAKSQGVDPVYLPHISNHILRHSFCTRLSEADVNVKVIQTVMGHASYTVTMDVYTKAHTPQIQQELSRVGNLC